MAELEAATELFDLFGETGFCTICQDDLAEGERVRAIRACQHLFHSRCLDPWLISKGDCPLCRTSVRRTTDTAVIADASQTIQTLYSTLQGAQVPQGGASVLQRILTHIEQLIDRTGHTAAVPPTPPNTTERMVLSYCIAHGMIKKFRSAAMFDAHKQAIRTYLGSFTLEGLRPLPIECDTFAALCRSRLTYKAELMTRLGLDEHAVLNAQPIREMKVRLSGVGAPLADYWRA